MVTYPFHPFAGQLVPIVGRIEHVGTRHLIIRTADKSGFLLPAWMTTPEAGAIQIVADPRLPLNRIIELRALVDRLMVSSSGEMVPTGGQRHEKNVTTTTAESIRPNTSSQRAVVPHRLKAMELLKKLLTEATLRTVIESDTPARKRAGNDQDHA